MNEAEAAVVRLIYEKYRDGMGVSKIAAWLNDQGIKPPGTGVNPSGKWRRAYEHVPVWQGPTVSRLIRKPRYCGVFLAYGGKYIIANPAADTTPWEKKADHIERRDDFRIIVDPKLWQHANRLADKRLAERGSTTPKAKPIETRFLSGRICCGECRLNFWSRPRKKSGELVWYCRGRRKLTYETGPLKQRCKNATVLPAGPLMGRVVHALEDVLANPWNLAGAVRDHQQTLGARTAELNSRLQPVIHEREDIQAGMHRWDVKFELGRMTEAEYRGKIAEAQDALERLAKKARPKKQDLEELEALRNRKAEQTSLPRFLRSGIRPRKWKSGEACSANSGSSSHQRHGSA